MAGKKNVNINAKKVNVNGPSNQVSQNTPNTRTRRRRRKNQGQPIPSIESGKMTSPNTASSLSKWRSDKIELSENAVGWYYKYCDPAGAVESGRSVGECGKIPDGLVKYSVDAEIREIYNDSCPGISSTNVPLDGKLWSYHIISFPMFRLGYIAVANRNDEELSDPIALELVRFLNNLVDWRQVVDADEWVNFSSDEAWFVRLRVLRPTYDLGESSAIRTVASWRMTYKSITTEFNTPTLINQGYWVGGHFAQDNTQIDRESSAEGASDLNPIDVQNTELFVERTSNAISFNWVGLRQGGVSTTDASNPRWVPNRDNQWFSWRAGSLSSTQPITNDVLYTLPEGVTLSRGGVTTAPGATIRITSNWATTPITFSVYIGSSGTENPLLQTLLTTTSTQSFVVIKSGEELSPTNAPGLAYQVELPPVTLEQMAPNNPKMEQFLLKDTEGSYIVHSKMRNPVFQLTPAKTFGSLTLDYPGYDQTNNLSGPLGIRDSFDANFSTGVVIFRGVSQSATFVNKLYQGWEGVTASHTPFGQFGHSGLEVNKAILDLADDLASVRLTGVYPAVDNFAAAVAGLASTMLAQAMKSEVTQNAIAGLGQQATAAVQQGIGNLPSLVGSLLGRIGNRIRQRRLAKRKARSVS